MSTSSGIDVELPITWVINAVNEITSDGAEQVATNISGIVSPLASICFGIYILLIALNYMRGAETEPVINFGLKAIGFAIVIGIGLNASNYTSTVLPIVQNLGLDLSNAVSRGTVNEGTLDKLAIHYVSIVESGFDENNRSWWSDPFTEAVLWLKAITVYVGLIPFLVAATLMIIVANIGSTIVAMIGPIFFSFLIFPATRQYFSSWLNTAFSYALIPLIVAVISNISVGISHKMLTSGANIYSMEFKVICFAAIGNLILLFVLQQVSSLASSLSAGGINAVMPGGVGAATAAINKTIRDNAKDKKSYNDWKDRRAQKKAEKQQANQGGAISNGSRGRKLG